MNIKHRVSFNSKKDEVLFHFVINANIKHKASEIPGGKSKFVWFDITESDPNWPELSQLIQTLKVVDIYDTFFSKSEILNAEWARLFSTYTEGYPQPFETWITDPINYNNNCRTCGTFQQVSNFQIDQEPTLRGHDFMTLNWAVSTFFCTPKVFENFESHQIKGYETWKVILTKTGSPVQKISQLFVPNETASGLLNRDELAPVKCSQCNITRYFHHQRGVMQYKRDAFDPDLDIIRSYEWFGSGRDGYQEVFVSNRVIKLIIEYGWKGVRFKVVKLV